MFLDLVFLLILPKTEYKVFRVIPSLSVSYIGRDANQAAHLCAKQASFDRKRCMWINYSLGFLTSALLGDRNPCS
jgi:hypothetical protein